MFGTVGDVGEKVVRDAVFEVGVSQREVLVLVLLQIPHSYYFLG